MTRDIRIGGVREATHLVEDLELPILPDIDALAWIVDAVDQAAAERKGIAVVGRKGAGKTIAATQAIREFEDAERLIEQEDDRYQRRRAVLVQSPRSKKPADVVAAVWKEAVGMEMRQYARGRKKSFEQLRDELVEKLLNMSIAVVIFDEAENLSQQDLEVLRDIISTAESRSQERISDQSYRAAGVGMVLIGTHALRTRLIRSEEAGHRWVSIREVEDLTPGEAARVYRAFLPAIDEHAEEVGEEEWNEYVHTKVVKGRKVPVRQVENHVRSYVRRVVAATEDDVETKADIPWDQELFEWTLSQLVKPGVETDGR